MPIHDQGYRRYAGSKAAKGQAWLVITRAGLRKGPEDVREQRTASGRDARADLAHHVGVD